MYHRGHRLTEYIRPGDTVARLAGDEFVLIMSDVASENDVASLARSVCSLVATSMVLDGQEVAVTASLGVAFFPKDGELAATLLQNADAAMQRAKELGCNSVQFYAPAMNARMLKNLVEADGRIGMREQQVTFLERDMDS